MQKIVIFNAGQSVRMIGNLLHGSCELKRSNYINYQ